MDEASSNIQDGGANYSIAVLKQAGGEWRGIGAKLHLTQLCYYYYEV